MYTLYIRNNVILRNRSCKSWSITTVSQPLTCISIAFFADKSGNINVIIGGFVIMLIGAILFASGIVAAGLNSLFILSLIIVAVTYIIRGLYFSSTRMVEFR